jgi:tetratricopeptide (TPR) repeat protein
MADSYSVQVLLRAAQRKVVGKDAESDDDLGAITEICTLLGGLPLALVQVGCYCHTTKINFSQYLERFKMHRAKLMAMQTSLQLDKYSYSTYTSIGLSYSLLDEQGRALLRLLAFFHPSHINLDILRIASKYEFRVDKAWELLSRDKQYDDHLDALRWLLKPDNSWDDFHVDSLLNQLQSFSLLSLSNLNGHTSITIHPLVQSCILDTLSPESRSLYFHMAALVLGSCSREEEIPLFQHLSAHIVELENQSMAIHPNELTGLAYTTYTNGYYEEAMRRWEKVREGCRQMNGEEDRSTLRMSYWIARCLYRMNRLEEAEVMLGEVVEVQEKVLGKEDNHTLSSYRRLSNILTARRKTEEAENILKRLLTLSEIKYGQEHWRTLSIQSSLAHNLFIQEQYAEVEVMSRSVLPIMKKELGDSDSIVLDTSNSLSLALMEEKKFADAEDVLREMITTHETKSGRQHPHTLTCLCTFARCLIQKGDLDEAEKVLREVIEAREKVLGRNHPQSIDALSQLEYVTQQKELRSSTTTRPTNPSKPPLPPPIRKSSRFSQESKARFNKLKGILKSLRLK